jgi:hypothetical protein
MLTCDIPTNNKISLHHVGGQPNVTKNVATVANDGYSSNTSWIHACRSAQGTPNSFHLSKKGIDK